MLTSDFPMCYVHVAQPTRASMTCVSSLTQIVKRQPIYQYSFDMRAPQRDRLEETTSQHSLLISLRLLHKPDMFKARKESQKLWQNLQRTRRELHEPKRMDRHVLDLSQLRDGAYSAPDVDVVLQPSIHPVLGAESDPKLNLPGVPSY